MNKVIEIIEKEIGNVIEVEERTYMWKMSSLFSKHYQSILNYFQSNNTQPSKAPYARYINIDWEKEMQKGMLCKIWDMLISKWHFYLGVPVSQKLEDYNNLKSNFIEKKRYLKAMHYGSYQKVGERYEEMYDYAVEKNISLGSESMEFYLNDPKEVEKEKLETMILISVIE